MQTVLLSVPPQAHDNEDQQNEHHDAQNAAHDQVEQAARLAGCICGEKAWRGYGALAGHTWKLTGWREKKQKKVSLKGWNNHDVFQENMSQVLHLLVTDLVFFNTYKNKLIDNT